MLQEDCPGDGLTILLTSDNSWAMGHAQELLLPTGHLPHLFLAPTLSLSRKEEVSVPVSKEGPGMIEAEALGDKVNNENEKM